MGPQTSSIYVSHKQNDNITLHRKGKKHEWKNILILTLAQKNGFPKNLIHDIKKKEIAKQKNKPFTTEGKQEKHTQNKKWTIFIYHSPLVRKVTNFFKNTDIRTAFKANNTIYQQLAEKQKIEPQVEYTR